MHDSEVVASITGDRSARLIEAYDRYADSLYRYCLASLGEQAEAASAVRDTFAIAAARLPGLREPDLLRAWLYAVARRECRHVRRPGRPAFAPTGVTAGRPGEDATRAWLRGLLEVAVTGLGPGEREVIELELRHGLAVAEIAGVVGLSRAQASALASRARQRLEAGLVAVVVGRAGRRECDWLRMTLADWDGWLTIPLRKQLQQHIGRCAACSTRRDLELHPARLLGHSPGEALADAAGFLVAPGPPDGLRAHTLALAFSEDPDAIAHRAAVLGRAGAFDPRGFPKQAPWDGDGPTGRRGRVAVAAGLVAVAVIGVAAVALMDGSGHGKQAARQLAGSPPPPGTAAAVPTAAPPGTTPTGSATPTAAAVTQTATGPASSAPTRTPVAPNRATTAAASPSATTAATATGSPSATAVAPGALAVSPSGGALVVPSGGRTISLTADGGPVTWSSTVSSGLGTVQLSPAGGTVNAGATVTVTVTASGLASGRTVTITPGGTAFTVFVGLG